MEEKIGVWLDCDPGLDDTFAIIYSALHKKLHLIGLSTSAGNTNLENTTKNARNILFNIGKEDIKVFPGSTVLIKGEMKYATDIHGSDGLGGVELPVSNAPEYPPNSFDNIYQQVTEWPEKIIWQNTGSLTNLCIMLQRYPNFNEKIAKIVLMGGAIGVGNRTPAAEFNIFFDPEAFKMVLNLTNGVPIVMIPLEVTHQNIADQKIFDRIKPFIKIPFAEAIYRMLEQYKEMYIKSGQFDYPPIHDPCVPHYIIHPDEFILKQAFIDVDIGETSYGRTNCYFKNINKPESQLKKNEFVAIKLKNEKVQFWDVMLSMLIEIFEKSIEKK